MSKTGYIGDFKYDEMDSSPQVAYRLTREQKFIYYYDDRCFSRSKN